MTDGSPHSDLDAAITRARRLLALLHELTEIGMELARGLRRELMEGASALDLEPRYCNIARAVRRLVALEARLIQAFDDVANGRWDADQAERELRTLTAKADQDAALEAIERAVREAGDRDAVARLGERLDDWHTERSIERDFRDTSVAEIVVGVCADLDVQPDPALLSEAAMAGTPADAVRAYAAALKAAPREARRHHQRPASWFPPPARPDALAQPRPPPN